MFRDIFSTTEKDLILSHVGHFMKEFILSFDIPRNLSTERRRINRELNKIGAEIIHDSLWKSKNLTELIKIATMIKKFGGKARILEEKLIFT